MFLDIREVLENQIVQITRLPRYFTPKKLTVCGHLFTFNGLQDIACLERSFFVPSLPSSKSYVGKMINTSSLHKFGSGSR